MSNKLYKEDTKKKKKKETATTTTAPRNPERHKVQRGETLASIAGQYGVTIADIREWNDLKSNNIMAVIASAICCGVRSDSR